MTTVAVPLVIAAGVEVGQFVGAGPRVYDGAAGWGVAADGDGVVSATGTAHALAASIRALSAAMRSGGVEERARVMRRPPRLWRNRRYRTGAFTQDDACDAGVAQVSDRFQVGGPTSHEPVGASDSRQAGHGLEVRTRAAAS